VVFLIDKIKYFSVKYYYGSFLSCPNIIVKSSTSQSVENNKKILKRLHFARRLFNFSALTQTRSITIPQIRNSTLILCDAYIYKYIQRKPRFILYEYSTFEIRSKFYFKTKQRHDDVLNK